MDSKKKGRKAAKQQAAAPPGEKQRPGLGELLDIPGAARPGMMQMELSGNTEAVVDGCTGVLEYDENIIRLSGGKMTVRFMGRGLQIKALTHSSAIITGYLISIEFLS